MKYIELPICGGRSGRVVTALAVTLFASMNASRAQALFDETFDGYTSFPNQNPHADWVNPGIPEISEGADEFWYGVRFLAPDDGTINQDLAVQEFGGSGNSTPVGRMEDNAGLVLRVDTTGYENVNLAFIWRTFLAESGDRLRVGYYVGDDLGFDTGANRFLDLTGAWSSWTQLMSASASSSFQSESFALPDNAGPVYVAFWLKNGEGDFGKVDNVLITGTLLIPEPSVVSLLLGGGAAFLAARHRRRQACRL
jgi:hypothetical protein